MNTHTAHYEFGFDSLRAALHLSQRPVPLASARQVESAAAADWLERLAIWAERQPMHHCMGSYTRRR